MLFLLPAIGVASAWLGWEVNDKIDEAKAQVQETTNWVAITTGVVITYIILTKLKVIK